MSFWTNFVDALLDALKDSARILPFMFAAFVVIGLIERGAGKRMVSVILAADKIGPLQMCIRDRFIAILLNQKMPGRTAFRAIFFIPRCV